MTINTFYFSSIDSTNDKCKQLVAEDPKILQTPFCVVSETQTHGKGSHGRDWDSSSLGGLYYSFCFTSSYFNFDYIETYNRLIAGIVIDVIKELSGLDAIFKSPNDVFLNGKKVAGILIETRSSSSNRFPGFVIVGIGLNINQTSFNSDLVDVATSLYMASNYSYTKNDFVTQLSIKLMSMVSSFNIK